MKDIKVHPRCPLVCEEPHCQYQKSCANHVSAGDFRIEGGMKPRLFYSQRKLCCETIDLPSFDSDVVWDIYPSEHHDSGFCDGPIEMTDNFQI
jgi:hypothetical protein